MIYQSLDGNVYDPRVKETVTTFRILLS